MTKLVFKDGLLNYRQLTDKTPKEIANDVEAQQGLQLPDDTEIVASKITYDSYMQKVNPKSGSTPFDKNTGVFELNGTTIDVLNTLKNLDHSEKSVNKLEQKLKEALEEIDRLKTLNRTNERIKSRLTDDIADSKKKLRDQIRTNKEIDDKYIRFKDLLQRSKSSMNKLSDEISDTLKRSQPQKESSIVNGVHSRIDNNNKKTEQIKQPVSATSEVTLNKGEEQHEAKKSIETNKEIQTEDAEIMEQEDTQITESIETDTVTLTTA